MGQKWTIFHSLILLPFRVTSTHSVTFYTFWGSSWGVPSTWRAPQRHKGPRASPQTRLWWLTRQKLAKSPPLCPCERETQTLNHWLLPQPWLCCCCSVSLSPPKLPLCVFFPMPGLWAAPGGSGQPRVAMGGCVWHCSPWHPQPALSWSSLYSLATLPLLHAGSLHKIYGSCSKFFSFFITSRSSLFLSNLGKPRPCSLKKKKDFEKKDFLYLFASLLMQLISMIQRRWRQRGPGIWIAKMAWRLLSDICASCNVTLWNHPRSPWIWNGFVTCLNLVLVWGWGLKNLHGPLTRCPRTPLLQWE